MAIRNTNLGGTDFVDGEIPDAADFNDTNDIISKSILNIGDGSDGAVTTSGNLTLTQGVTYQYTSFTLSLADTLSCNGPISSPEPVVIKVQGDCTINGTIDFSGKGYPANEGAFSANFSTPGLTPSGTSVGAAGGLKHREQVAVVYYPTDSFVVLPGTGGGTGGIGYGDVGTDYVGGGGGGGACLFDGSAGANGTTTISGNTGGAAGGAGGAGGATLILIVGGTLTFGASSVVNFDGANGSIGGFASYCGGGGGGGAGGSFVFLYNTAFTDNGATISVNGGTGGSGRSGTSGTSGAGGTGAKGAYYIGKIGSPYNLN